jgi:carboxylesterase type B
VLADAIYMAPAIANTSLGTLVGLHLSSGVKQFLGVPYATASRLEAAQPRTRRYTPDPLPALDFGPACLQFLTANTTYGAEVGCLVLNAWLPPTAGATSSVPTLVYVPGGENAFGEAGPYNASQLALDQHVVVAALNYRVGPFGFLAFEEDVVAKRPTGNYALTDIQAGLAYLRRELAHAFGGDPEQLTLFGQSSGGGLALMHAFLPSSRGLMRGILSESSDAAAVSLRSALANTRQVARALRCAERGFNASDSRACVLASSGASIVAAQGITCANPSECLVSTPWAPVVDGHLLPDTPAALLHQHAINTPLSVAVGFNTNDSNLFVSGITERLPFAVPAAAYTLAVRIIAGGSAAHAAALLRHYPPLADPRANHSSRLGWLLSDRDLCGARRLAAHLDAAGATTYAYRFNHWFRSNTICTAVPNYHAPSLGAMHQDELSFVFAQPIFMDLGGVLPNCSVRSAKAFDPSCLGCQFDTLEAGFATSVGALWSRFATQRRRSTGEYGAGEWPAFSATHDVNLVLEPDRSAAHLRAQRMRAERAFGREAACRLWDAIDAGSGVGRLHAMRSSGGGGGALGSALEAALRDVSRTTASAS